MRLAGPFLLTLLFLGSLTGNLRPQEAEQFRFHVLPQSGMAEMEVGDLLSDAALLDAVHSGLPLRVRLQVQLWKDGFFDDQKGQFDWRATILFVPLTRRYRILLEDSTQSEVEVNTLSEARRILQTGISIPLRPQENGRYYYMADVVMETLSLSDLEELQRWLQGDLAPAVAREGDVGSALARGARRVLVRMLGLPARKFRVRSPPFQVNRPGGG
jgi:hypothetical protein